MYLFAVIYGGICVVGLMTFAYAILNAKEINPKAPFLREEIIKKNIKKT